MSGIITAQLLNAALIAQPSPGSVFAVLALTPRGKFFANIMWIVVGTLVTFVTAALLLKVTEKDTDEEEGLLETAREKVAEAKHGSEKVLDKGLRDLTKEQIHLIVFACDAGMGSSAAAAGVIKKRLKDAGVKAEVKNSNLESIPAEADLVICHENLKDRARKNAPDKAILTVSNYLNAPEYDMLVQYLKE